MAKEIKFNNTLVSGAADETLTYTRYIKDESSGKSAKELLEEKVNKTDKLGTTQLENKSVTAEKLAENSVDGRKVCDGSIENRHIGNNAVSTSKIASRSVTNEKIAHNSVSRAELTPDVRTSIDKKADAEQVNNSLYDLEKKIGERFVVEGDVTNLPDEEDLTSANESERDVLKLADRSYAPEKFSGKGYKILRRNIKLVSISVTKIRIESVPSANGTLSFSINGKEIQVTVSASTDNRTTLVAQKVASAIQESITEYDVSTDASLITLTRKSGGSVTPSVFSASTTGVVCTITDSTKREFRNILTSTMINQPNTIYEIRYDFDLDGETIDVPENCVLEFDGGSFRNGKIIFDKTLIEAKEVSIFNNISISGTLNNLDVKVDWFSNKNITTINEILDIRYSRIPNIYINETITAEEPIKINKPVNLHCDNFEFHQSTWGYPGIIINSSDVAIYGKISVHSDVSERTAITNTYFSNIVDKKASSSAICLGSLSEPKQIENIYIEKCYLYNFIAGILSHGKYNNDWGVKNTKIDYCYVENIDFGIFGASWYGLFINMLEFKNIASYTNSEDPSHVVYITGGDNEIASENIVINNLVGSGCISKTEDSVLSLKSCASFRCLNSTVNNIGYFAAVLNSKCNLSNIYIDDANRILGAQLEGTICNVRNVIARNVKTSAFSCSTHATLKVADCDIEYARESASNEYANYVSEGVAEFTNCKIKAPDNSTAPFVFYNSDDVNSKLTIYNPITNMDIVKIGNGANPCNIKVYLNPLNVDTEKILKTSSLLRLSITLLENNDSIKTTETAYPTHFLVSKIVDAKVSTINRIYAPKNQFLILRNGGDCTLIDSDDIILKQANEYKANSWNTLAFVSTGQNSIEELFCDYHPNGSFNDKPTPKRIGLQYFNTDTNKTITWDGNKWRNPDGTEATS